MTPHALARRISSTTSSPAPCAGARITRSTWCSSSTRGSSSIVPRARGSSSCGSERAGTRPTTSALRAGSPSSLRSMAAAVARSPTMRIRSASVPRTTRKRAVARVEHEGHRQRRPEQERLRAAVEGEGLGGLGEQRDDRGDAQQRRALVERRLVQDVLVAVVEPGGLRQQAHERDERQDPRRQVGRGEERDDDERAAQGEHVRGQQREAPERVATADARGRPTSSRNGLGGARGTGSRRVSSIALRSGSYPQARASVRLRQPSYRAAVPRNALSTAIGVKTRLRYRTSPENRYPTSDCGLLPSYSEAQVNQ